MPFSINKLLESIQTYRYGIPYLYLYNIYICMYIIYIRSPKWRPPRYLCLLYLSNRSTDFHQIFNKNLEIYCLLWICYNFNNGRKQNGLQNGVHLDICVYYISSTILLIFIKFSQKPRNIFPTYGNLL